jgi:hypothetical protein
MNLTVLDQAAHAIAQEPPDTWASWLDYVVEAMETPDADHSEQPALVASWRARYLAMLQKLQRSLQQRQADQRCQRAIERKWYYQ